MAHPMLSAYWFCLVAGVVLISFSLHDGGDVDGDGGSLTILFSTPFWSFGLTGFGLSGVLMTVLSPTGSWIPSSLVALVLGLGMGVAAAKLLVMLSRRTADSLVHSDDLIGLQGLITLEADTETRGFVEVSVKGSLLRRPALSSNGKLAKNTSVVVIASDEHTLRVEALDGDSL